ncbi:tRNA uridine-5-carboxymethylaminomethyl(34) synthesis GTPase MnmE [Hyphococcus formosus]|uniref:tRNA uridine-5-carboxymethylaminomethyl(34) synthesis GTPase MnmE n=1 Tax=Hyphococcus formosus TaxID=3143534 RepID=UPI00398B2933
MMAGKGDTIFAKASGAGKAGVSVYRLSGPAAHAISAQLVGRQIKLREAALVALRDPKDGAIIDRGLAILFENPKSFTGEDVAEFHLHGSHAVEISLYEVLSRLGARPAEAGEFTLRALKNGKLDLAQAEALADLIDAETTLQKKQALGQLDGRLSAVAEDWRREILAVMAPLEADIDFPDEGDVPAAIAAAAGPAIARLRESLIAFLDTSGRARTIREGVSIAIIGPPNAGKSSLVNALAGSEIAIVSDIAGTTRDIVETRLDLGGVVAAIADTAGLHGAQHDVIEAEGMRRARARAEGADLRVAVLDPRSEFVSRETLDLLRPGDFLIWSKADLSTDIPDEAPEGVIVHQLSSKSGAGLPAFVEKLTAAVAGGANADGPALTRARHVKAVEEAIDALARAEANITRAPELAAEDARLAARALGQITGAVGVEDILGEIFSSFCIGK